MRGAGKVLTSLKFWRQRDPTGALITADKLDFIDEQVAKGKTMPEFLERYEIRPPQDYAWASYNTAYARLAIQRPIPFSEIKDYHESFDVPFSLGVFVDAMRTLEIEDMQQETNRVNNARQ